MSIKNVKIAQKKVVQQEIVYGVHPVVELLNQKKRKVYEIYVVNPEPKIWPTIKKLLPTYPVIVHRVTRDLLAKKAGTTDHQGVMAFAAPFALRKKFFDPKQQQFLVLLDGIQDVRNLGAIIRSSYCTGVDGVIICKKQGAELTGAALKASAGLAERMDIYEAPSVPAALQELKQAGYNLYVTALGGKQSITSLNFQRPLCVVIGNEGDGVSSEAKKSGTIITLPQRTHDISYNASVAAGIVLFMIAYGKSSSN